MVFLWLPWGLITTQNIISLKAQDRIWIGSRLTDTRSAENDWIGADTEDASLVKDTVTLLQHFSTFSFSLQLSFSHKVSLSKLQFVRQQVTFLGHVITPNSKSLSDKRIQGIKDVPKPITKKQMSFLGMCSYYGTFIPNYATLEQPLRALTVGKGLRSCDKIEWTGGSGGIC